LGITRYTKQNLSNMKIFNILLVIVIAFNLSNCSGKDSHNKESKTSKEDLLKTIDKFNKAFQEGNVVVIKSMITENYVHTNGNSKPIGKRDWLNYLRKRETEIKSGELEVAEYKIGETEIEFYGGMAIVTGKVVVSNRKKELTQKSEYRITNVWVNESGSWKRAGFHDGKIK